MLLNNAVYGAYGPLEAFDMEAVRRQFDTNVIGLLALTKAVLPHMRSRGAGTIMNIASMGGKITFPLGTLYHGTKFAVERLSEALHYELSEIGVRMRIVEPGSIKTDFGGRSFVFRNDESMAEYQPLVKKLFATFGPMAFAYPSGSRVGNHRPAACIDWPDVRRFHVGTGHSVPTPDAG